MLGRKIDRQIDRQIDREREREREKEREREMRLVIKGTNTTDRNALTKVNLLEPLSPYQLARLKKQTNKKRFKRINLC